MHKNKIFFFCAGIMLLLISLGIVYLVSMEHDAPQIRLLAPAQLLTPDIELTLEVSDQTSGLKTVQVDMLVGEQRITLLREEYTNKTPTRSLNFKIQVPDVQTSPARQTNSSGILDPSKQNALQVKMEILAHDNSTANWWSGNTAIYSADFILDCAPPTAENIVLSDEILQGGSAALNFEASEPLRAAYVEAGGHKFKIYEQAATNHTNNDINSRYAGLFAFPYQVSLNEYQPVLVLEDQVGHISRQALPLKLRASSFRPDSINLSEQFMLGKAEEFAGMIAPGFNSADILAQSDHAEKTPLKLFLIVNNAIRAHDYAQLAKYGENSAQAPLWHGAFMRLPRSMQRSKFADQRIYIYQNQIIDRKVHQGIDLASIIRDQIPAAGSGLVIAAGYLGIHGNMVLIDHGLGLQSLYSHLSEIQVSTGSDVEKGQIIGHTGTSGMAGGDHLHFEFLLSGVSVTPEEWLDAAWTAKIESVLR